MRYLILILGDQLDIDSTVLRDFDPGRDAVWMAEVAHEATFRRPKASASVPTMRVCACGIGPNSI